MQTKRAGHSGTIRKLYNRMVRLSEGAFVRDKRVWTHFIDKHHGHIISYVATNESNNVVHIGS